MKILPGINVPEVTDSTGSPTPDAMMIGALINDLLEKALAVVPSTNSTTEVRKAAEDLKKAFMAVQASEGL